MLGICLSLALLAPERLDPSGLDLEQICRVNDLRDPLRDGLIGWILVAIAVLASQPDRNWLAAAIERIDRRFLDRLNTLLFLEGRRYRGHSQLLRHSDRATDSKRFWRKNSRPPAFSARTSLAWFATLLVALLALVFTESLSIHPGSSSRSRNHDKPPVNSTTFNSRPSHSCHQ